jgi:hypothetical protein
MFIVELPSHHLVPIQPFNRSEDDSLMDELLALNPRFQALVEKSKASRRKPLLAERDRN